ncbi:auxin response factor 4-like protein [Tanacetum coccineum]
MSDQAASAKKTMFVEVTSSKGKPASSKKHMSVEVTSSKGKAASSKKNMSVEVTSSKGNKHKDVKPSQEIIPMQGASSGSVLFLDELEVGVTRTIVVMLCRLWDVCAVTCRFFSTDLVVSDARPNREDYRIQKDDTFMLEFDKDTTMHKSLVQPVNAAGYVTNVGRPIQQQTGSRTLDFYLANERGHMLKVTLWGSLCDILVKKKARLYLSSSSSNIILDDVDIPACTEGAACGEQVSDETAHVVVVMFDETATELVKCSADRLRMSKKRLCKQPSISTPLKPAEEKKNISNDDQDIAILTIHVRKPLMMVFFITMVHKQEKKVGRAIDLSKMLNYDELFRELESLFHMEGILINQDGAWRLLYMDEENYMMVVGDDPWDDDTSCLEEAPAMVDTAKSSPSGQIMEALAFAAE